MKNLKKNIIYRNNIQKAHLRKKTIAKHKSRVTKAINHINKNINLKKNTLHYLSKDFKLNFINSELKKYKKFKNVLVVGMGGSILGIEAIYYFLKNKIKKNFLFLDNLDEEKFLDMNKKLNFKKCLFIIISKSGSTTETLTNINLLKQKQINLKNTIIISENKNTALRSIARKINALFIEHKDSIGGRYSVLTEVGMLPEYLMGLDINNFRKNILSFFKKKHQLFLIDSILKLSDIYSKKKINSIIFFNYCPELQNFLFWCQQLLAESLGKKGKGLLPVISQAPKDHHSLLQLYLDGPRDKIFYIFSINTKKSILIKNNFFSDTFRLKKNIKLINIINAQKNAFIAVLKKRNIPFREFEINNFKEETLGELFTYFILETILLGNDLGVNPFDQPSVESVKALTKKYLF